MAFLKYRASLTPTVPTSNSIVSTGLTNLEVDGNFKSLDDAKVERSGDTITGSLQINTDLAVTGNSNINHTSGRVDGIPIGNTTAVTIVKVDNLSLDGNTLASTNAGGHIILAPNGTGDVQLDTDTVRVGDSNSAATITTNGTGNLTLNTNGGTTSGSIVINQGAAGAISITPEGAGTVNVGTATGVVNVKGNLDVDGDVNIDGGDLTVSTATFNLANATATTLNLAGAATTVNLGHVGTAARTINIATAATDAASTLNFGGAVTGNVLEINSVAAGTVTIRSDVTTGTVNLFTGTSTGTVNVGSAAAGKLAVAFNTTATSTSTGALTVAGGASVTENLWVGGYFNVDNLRLENNTISSTNTDSNIVLAPNGAGDVQLDADTVRVGDSGAAATLTSNGAGALTVTTGGAANLVLNTNSGTTSGSITINNGANGNITFALNGTGTVNLPSVNVDAGTIDGVSIGGASVATFVGVDNLSLDANTLASTNANGDINITPNGTGTVNITKTNIDAGTIDGVSIGSAAVATFIGVDNLSLDGNTLASTNTNGNIVLAPNGTGDVQVDADTLRVGDSGVDATITTNGTGDLILNTNAGTNSGSIRIYDAANGNIDVTTNGTGVINLHDITLRKWTATNTDIDGLLPGSAFGTMIQGPDQAHLVVGLRDNDVGDSFSVISGGGNYTTDTTYDTVVAYFKSSGEVGLGTSNPGARLDVRGSAIFNEDGAAVDFRVEGDTNTHLLYVDATDDRVGINNSAPTYKFEVTTGAQGIDGLATTNGTNSVVVRPNSGAGNSNPLVQAQDKAIIYSNGTVETGNLVIAPWSTSNFGIRMTNAGNVGINMSPNSAYALDVSGAIRNFGSQALLATAARADAQVEIGSGRATGSGTWAASASITVTVTSNAHGYATGNRVDLVFTMATGTNATSGNYAVTVTDANTFTIVNPASITGTGTVTIGSAGAAYIDLVTDTTNTDYGFRIFRGNTGANSATQLTNKGTGALSIQTESTGPIVINTNGTTRAIFDGNSHVVTLGNAGTSATPTASTIIGATGGQGTNISATQLILRGGLSTGNATGGSISFQTGTVGSTGTTAQTATERLRIETSTASTTLDLVTPATTANVLNANATTLNLAGAATSISLGHVGTTARTVNIATAATGGASAMTFGGGVTGNIFKVSSTAAGTVNYTSDVTTGVVNLFTGTTTGTVNVGSADAGKLAVVFNTSATSTTTGALTVAGGAGVTENLWVGGYINVDNLRLQDNTLSSTNTDGNIVLAPNGTGDVYLDADTVRVGDAGAAATITTNGNGNLTLRTGSTDFGSIVINQGTDGNIVLTPHGAGDVQLDADTVRVGDSGAAAKLISNGTGALTITTGGAANLVLSTNDGTSSGTITINNGANGDIAIQPDGTGDVLVNADTLRVGDSGAASTITTNGAGNLTLRTGSTNSGSILINQGDNGNIEVTPHGDGDVYLNADTLRVGDSNAATTVTTNGTGNLTLRTGSTNSGSILINQGDNGNIVVAPHGTGDVQLDADTVRIGDAGQAVTLVSNGDGNLTLRTGSTDFGSIVINQGTNGNIVVTPHGTGDVQLDADTVRIGDADTDVTLTTNGASSLTINTGSVGATSSGNTISITGGSGGSSSGAGGSVTLQAGSAGASGSGGALNLYAGLAVGSNQSGSNVTINAGNGTGTGGSGVIIFQTASAGSTGSTANTLSERVRITNGGNVLIGKTSVSGEKIGLGGLTASYTSGASAIGLYDDTTVGFAQTSSYYSVSTNIGTQASAFTLSSLFHYGANQASLGTNSTISNQYGFSAASGLVGAAFNYGFHSAIPLGSTASVSNVARTTNVVTITTASAHGFTLGQRVVIAVATNTSINGTFTIASVPSSTTFTYSQTGTNITSVPDTGSATITGRWNFFAAGQAPNYFAGDVELASTTSSTSTSTGALRVAGGLGVTENLWVGGYINIDNLRLQDNTLSSVNTNGNIGFQPNGTGGILFNDAAANVDVRMEGQNDANLFYSDASVDRIGVGINAPQTKLHVQQTSATTNAVTDVLRLDIQSSGTPAVGIGVGVEFAVETSANNTEVGATIEAVTTDVTAGSEDFDIVFRTMIAGAAAAQVGKLNNNTLQIGADATATTITTQGAGNLVLTTGATNTGSITLNQGTNGNITFALHGTGEVVLPKVNIDAGAIDGTPIGSSSRSTGAFTTLDANGNVTLGDAAADNITVNGTVTSNLIFTDNTYDIGASGTTRPRSLFLSQNATLGGSLTVNGSATLGDAAADNVTVNGTITSNLIFTDNTYDIGASGATRPRSLFLSQNATLGGNLTVNGNATLGDALADTITFNGVLANGTALRTNSTAGNAYTLQAYDNNDATYRSLVTITASDVPSIAIGVAGSTVSINYASIGATSAGSGAFTSLSASDKFTRSGNITAASWTTAGVAAQFGANTFTDNTSPAGTPQAPTVIAKRAAVSLNAPTFAATNANINTTNAINLYVEAPIAGSNVTATNSYGIYNEGNLYTGGSATIVGALTVNGPTTFLSTSLTVTGKQVVVGQIAASTGLSGTISAATGSAPFTASITGVIEPAGIGEILTKTSGTGAFGTNTRITAISGSPGAYILTIQADTAITNGSIVFNTSGPTDYSADQGGLLLKGTTDKSLLWVDSTDSWTFNQNVESTGRFKSGNFVYDGTGAISLTNTTQTSIDSNAFATVRSIKYIIQATYGSEYQYSEIMMVTGGTTATTFLTEYANVFTGSAPLVSYDGDVSGSNMRLLATATAATTSLKILKIYTV